MKTIINRYRILIAICGAIFTFASCDDTFLDQAKPKGQISNDAIFADAGAIQMLVNGLYEQWGTIQGTGGYAGGLTLMSLECFSDEVQFKLDPSSDSQYYISANYDATDISNKINPLWAGAYQVIYTANMLIEGLPTATASITDAQRNTYLAQAYFLRGQTYFYHALLFGDVPLVLSTDAKANLTLPRTAKATILAQAKSDIEKALSLLPATAPSNTIYYTSKYQVEAYLSYVYLALGEYTKAETAADDVITKGGFSLVSDLQAIFDTGSKEAILSAGDYNSTVKGYADYGGQFNVAYDYIPYLLFLNLNPSDSLVRAYGTDPRLAKWYPEADGANQPRKYRYCLLEGVYSSASAPIPQTNIFMRLAEVYLIRAEARIQQATATSIANGIADINIIRARAGATDIPTATYTQAQAMKYLETERVLELSLEGRRWIDLARWGTTDKVFQNLKANYKTDWASHKALLPIPQKQISLNPNLKPNNPGY